MAQIRSILSLFLLSLVTLGHAQYDIPVKPEFIPPVIDSTQTLNSIEYRNLYDKLRNYNDSTSTEIIVVIIPTTKGENIGLLAPRWGHEWGIGQAKEDNGVFILLAKNDRNIWIAPGYGVEHRLTAGQLGQLTREIIIPEFKRGNYYEGLDRGTDAIIQLLAGEYQAKPRKTENEFPAGLFIFLLFVLIIFIIAISRNRKGRGPRPPRRFKDDASRDIIEAIILSKMGKGRYRRSSGGFGGFGRSGGGSGSGGFGGFGGGGGFSGGGAGGSW